MSRRRKLALWVTANLISVPLVFFWALRYFQQMVKEEYASGARTSPDGDIVVIPAAGIALTWVYVVIIVNLLILAIGAFRRYRNRGHVPAA